MAHDPDRVASILDRVTDWAKSRPDVRGLALAGSRARGQAREDSDIDLLLLTGDPNRFRDPAWLADLDWPRARWSDEEYGAVWSRRIWLNAEAEIKLSFAYLAWADVSPIDPGTRKVFSDGFRIVYDPDGLFERLAIAIRAVASPHPEL